MARRRIREYDAKQMIALALQEEYRGILVDETTELDALPQQYPWLQGKLVVKPDQLFGQRKKQGLVLAKVNFEQIKQFIRERMGQQVAIGKAEDKLTHFLIEPFIPHEKEYYLAFTSEREHDTIHFSEQGGVEIEDNWSTVHNIIVPTQETPTLNSIPSPLHPFVQTLYTLFREHDISFLEINPFTLYEGKIVLLDTVAEIDDCAPRNGLKFPREFGKRTSPEEAHIEELDRQSGASLKLTILNPQGRIWNILGGGGASIIYLDMIANIGLGKEIANYGELSGNPSVNESYEYAKIILQLMMKHNGKILFIVGGIANFTDVQETFKGYIKALEEYGTELQARGIMLFIRRGGPNWEKGLQSIRECCEHRGITHYIHGPETSMPDIIKIARENIP